MPNYDAHEMRVTEVTGSATPGDFILTVEVKDSPSGAKIHHDLLYEWVEWSDVPEAHLITWTPGTDSVFLEDLAVLAFVDQYFEHHGILTRRVLGDGMYVDDPTFEHSAPLFTPAEYDDTGADDAG